MRVRALFGFGLLLAACVDDKPTPSLSGSSSGSPSSSPDGGSVAGAVIATFNEDSGCSGWDPSAATFASDPMAKAGAGACRMCWDGTKDSDGNGYAFANLFVKADLTPGTHYAVSVYLRNVSDQPPLEDVQVLFGGVDESEVGLDEERTHATLTTTWTSIVTELAVTNAKTKSLHVLIQGQQAGLDAGHGCLAFDELVITRK